jgi:protease secretion system outer membrane protein
MNKKITSLMLLMGVGLTNSPIADAYSLNEAFVMAKSTDPKYQVATYDSALNNYQADSATMAFTPTVSYSHQEQVGSSTDSLVGNTVNYKGNTISVSQPLFSVEKYKLYQQAEPRKAYANASLVSSEQELATRLFSAVGCFITATEAIKSNSARIKNLQTQAERAKRLFDLGQGTVTDKRDVEVKLQQALANHMSFKINQRNAQMQIATLTQTEPALTDFSLPETHDQATVPALDELVNMFREASPTLLAARSMEEISKLEASRARSQVIPTLSLTHTKAFGGSSMDRDSTMLNVSVPIDAGKVIGVLSADATEIKAQETRRQVEEQALLQLNQFYESVVLGSDALRNKRSAVEAAELSVAANERSSQAGVRTTIEVLNSIDMLYQARNEYATSAVNIATALLNLLLLSAHSPENAISQTQSFLFKVK